ncbi:unnamed protein product [Pylaiella littoralis]
MLPATAPGRNTPNWIQNLPRLDRYATALIPERLRHIWEAWFVETDGNCLWRALAKALWDCDQFWPHLKARKKNEATGATGWRNW